MATFLTLHPNILATLAYFDQVDYPLTLQEIQNFLTATPDHPLPAVAPSVSEVELALRQLPAVSSWRGFYFLHRSEAVQARAEALVAERLKRYDIAERKWQQLRPKIKTISSLPYVRAVFVVNTLSWSNARADSDIDLCIITAPGHIWTARQWVTGWAALKRDRPSQAREADTLCLSLYLTADHLDLRPVTVNQQDIHLAVWLAQFHPVYDPQGLHQQLWAANPWAQKLLPYAEPVKPEHRRRLRDDSAGSHLRHALQHTLETAQPKQVDRLYKRWQLRIMPATLTTKANTPGVVISDSMLKFHDQDPRTRLHAQWQQQLAQLLTP